ncbi:MAG: creatininase family protein [Candidatus Eiseniibacteriota bacterium]
MSVRQLAELTWEEVRGLDRSRTALLMPCGAIEAHGPHLPLNTDVVIAEAMAREGAAQLSAAGVDAVLLPALVFTAAPFAAEFEGTISVPPATVTTLIVDLARELTRQGFALLGLANAHLDPAHRASLADAAARARSERLLKLVCPDLTRKPWATRLSEEFKSGACHAGRFEGSIVMAARPDLVRDEIRHGLAPNPASLSNAIRVGARTFAEAGGPRAYFGWPAEASAEEGRHSVELLGAILAEAVQSALVSRRDA